MNVALLSLILEAVGLAITVGLTIVFYRWQRQQRWEVRVDVQHGNWTVTARNRGMTLARKARLELVPEPRISDGAKKYADLPKGAALVRTFSRAAYEPLPEARVTWNRGILPRGVWVTPI